MEQLYQIALERRDTAPEGSYTAYLFAQGLDKILKKVGEECAETIIAAKNGDDTLTVGETADLLYHLIVMLVQCGIPLQAVYDELERRAQKQRNLKQFKETDRDT